MERRKPGRKSAAALSVVPFEPAKRPDPPDNLGEAGTRLWHAAVSAYPAGHFDGALPLLEAYARTVDSAELLHRDINAYDGPMTSPAYSRVLRQSGRQTTL